MRDLFKLLVVNAFRDILRYKSFLLLIFVIMVADDFASRFAPKLSLLIEKPDLSGRISDLSVYLFTLFPSQLLSLVQDYRVFLLLIGGFFLKAVISLWPSSDMRTMHRGERHGFGLLTALRKLKWKQLGWDLMAVLTTCLLALVWIVCFYLFSLLFYYYADFHGSSIIVLVAVFIVWPIIVAGFSYSSKIAVISQGNFKEKLFVFFMLYRKTKILSVSWLFFGFRIYLEVFVIAVIPMLISMYSDNWLLRVALVSLVACPIYALLKMVSFKLFLHLFKDEKLVRDEYSLYYHKLNH